MAAAMAPLSVQVLGAGCDVGRSCLVVTLEDGLRVMFDCGAHPAYGDERRFPNFDSIPDIGSLSCVLISHFHLDHAAALPYFTEKLGVDVPVYMTAPTADLTRLMLFDFLRTSRARGQHCPYNEEDIHQSLGKVKFVDLERPVTLPEAPALTVTAHYSGHAFGAVMLAVRSNRHHVLYSGDYTTTSDRLLRAACVPAYSRPQLFISEATYCSTNRKGGRRKEEESLMQAICDAISSGGRVLVAVPALGTAQEVLATLSSHWAAYALGDTPVYMAEGLISRANAVYETNDEWKQAGAEIRGESISIVRAFNRNQHWHIVEGLEPCILFATPGNLSTGLSLDVFREWCGDERNLIVVPGFSLANTLAAQYMGEGAVGEIRCKTHNMSFSGHADASGIRQVIRTLRPECVMLVHGDKKKIEAFGNALHKEYSIPVLVPQNGQTVDVPCVEVSGKAWFGDMQQFSVDRSVPSVANYMDGKTATVSGFAGIGFEERRVRNFSAVLSAIEEKVGSLRRVGPGEYCIGDLFVSQVQEEDGVDSLIIEWTKPQYRVQSTRILNVVDRMKMSPPESPAAQRACDEPPLKKVAPNGHSGTRPLSKPSSDSDTGERHVGKLLAIGPPSKSAVKRVSASRPLSAPLADVSEEPSSSPPSYASPSKANSNRMPSDRPAAKPLPNEPLSKATPEEAPPDHPPSESPSKLCGFAKRAYCTPSKVATKRPHSKLSEAAQPGDAPHSKMDSVGPSAERSSQKSSSDRPPLKKPAHAPDRQTAKKSVQAADRPTAKKSVQAPDRPPGKKPVQAPERAVAKKSVQAPGRPPAEKAVHGPGRTPSIIGDRAPAKAAGKTVPARLPPKALPFKPGPAKKAVAGKCPAKVPRSKVPPNLTPLKPSVKEVASKSPAVRVESKEAGGLLAKSPTVRVESKEAGGLLAKSPAKSLPSKSAADGPLKPTSAKPPADNSTTKPGSEMPSAKPPGDKVPTKSPADRVPAAVPAGKLPAKPNANAVPASSKARVREPGKASTDKTATKNASGASAAKSDSEASSCSGSSSGSGSLASSSSSGSSSSGSSSVSSASS